MSLAVQTSQPKVDQSVRSGEAASSSPQLQPELEVKAADVALKSLSQVEFDQILEQGPNTLYKRISQARSHLESSLSYISGTPLNDPVYQVNKLPVQQAELSKFGKIKPFMANFQIIPEPRFVAREQLGKLNSCQSDVFEIERRLLEKVTESKKEASSASESSSSAVEPLKKSPSKSDVAAPPSPRQATVAVTIGLAKLMTNLELIHAIKVELVNYLAILSAYKSSKILESPEITNAMISTFCFSKKHFYLERDNGVRKNEIDERIYNELVGCWYQAARNNIKVGLVEKGLIPIAEVIFKIRSLQEELLGKKEAIVALSKAVNTASIPKINYVSTEKVAGDIRSLEKAHVALQTEITEISTRISKFSVEVERVANMMQYVLQKPNGELQEIESHYLPNLLSGEVSMFHAREDSSLWSHVGNILEGGLSEFKATLESDSRETHLLYTDLRKRVCTAWNSVLLSIYGLEVSIEMLRGLISVKPQLKFLSTEFQSILEEWDEKRKENLSVEEYTTLGLSFRKKGAIIEEVYSERDWTFIRGLVGKQGTSISARCAKLFSSSLETGFPETSSPVASSAASSSETPSLASLNSPENQPKAIKHWVSFDPEDLDLVALENYHRVSNELKKWRQAQSDEIKALWSEFKRLSQEFTTTSTDFQTILAQHSGGVGDLKRKIDERFDICIVDSGDGREGLEEPAIIGSSEEGAGASPEPSEAASAGFRSLASSSWLSRMSSSFFAGAKP